MPPREQSSITWTVEKDRDLLFAIVMTHLTEQKNGNLQLKVNWGRVSEMMSKTLDCQTTPTAISQRMTKRLIHDFRASAAYKNNADLFEKAGGSTAKPHDKNAKDSTTKAGKRKAPAAVGDDGDKGSEPPVKASRSGAKSRAPRGATKAKPDDDEMDEGEA